MHHSVGDYVIRLAHVNRFSSFFLSSDSVVLEVATIVSIAIQFVSIYYSDPVTFSICLGGVRERGSVHNMILMAGAEMAEQGPGGRGNCKLVRRGTDPNPISRII